MEQRRELKVDVNIPCSDIRKDMTVAETDEYQDTEYVCDLEHTAKSGNLKGEDNPRYADITYYLHGKKCSKCSIPFEGTQKLNIKSFKISSRNLCYACVDQACTFYVCGDCYKKDLVME